MRLVSAKVYHLSAGLVGSLCNIFVLFLLSDYNMLIAWNCWAVEKLPTQRRKVNNVLKKENELNKSEN